MKILKIITLCILLYGFSAFFYVFNSGANSFPRFLYSSVGENAIHPTGDFSVKFTYEDTDTGINISTDNLELYKYSNNSWGNNIANNHIDFSTKIIGTNHAQYSLSNLSYGKYKFVFNISNNENNAFTKEIVFFVDEPKVNIGKAEHDIGNLVLNEKKLSDTSQNIEVKTIGAPYTLQMKNEQNLTQTGGFVITPYDNSKGWGYNTQPYRTNDTLTPLTNITDLNNSPLKTGSNGEKYTDNYIYKVGAINTDKELAAGEYEGEIGFDINFQYCNNYANNGIDCKEEPLKITETNGIKTWEDGTFAKTCYYYKNPETSTYSYLGDIGDGIYTIQPDLSQPAFDVYCDMTTNGGGWTKYVDIKGNYSFSDAKKCWAGENISNTTLECFNPNRYNIDVEQLYNEDWSGEKYYSDIPNIGASTTTQSVSGIRRCVGHNDFMTIMRRDTYPGADTVNTQYVRLGRNFCTEIRDPAGISSSVYMSYDTRSAVRFGTSTGAARQQNAKLNKLFFRETTKTSAGIKTVISENSIKLWSDGTVAKDCNEYKNPKLGYSYTGSIGSGQYYIDNDESGENEKFVVDCDMETDNGGWTKIQEWKTGTTNSFISGEYHGGEEILMTYKRKDSTDNNYAIKITDFNIKQCGEEYKGTSSYINHLVTGNWGSCGRVATTGDYNNIKTEKIIEGDFIEDTCVNGIGHKTTARNTSWSKYTVSGIKRGWVQFRVSNSTVLMGPRGNGSARCAGRVQSNRKQTEVTTWSR